jgi:hypothetical protein
MTAVVRNIDPDTVTKTCTHTDPVAYINKEREPLFPYLSDLVERVTENTF